MVRIQIMLSDKLRLFRGSQGTGPYNDLLELATRKAAFFFCLPPGPTAKRWTLISLWSREVF
jgi:hypothetical protein